MDTMIAQELYNQLYDSPKTVHNTPTEEVNEKKETCNKNTCEQEELNTFPIDEQHSNSLPVSKKQTSFFNSLFNK